MRSLRLAFFLFLIVLPAGAGDDIEVVSALWSDFVSALRRGDYPQAYGLFSAESRGVMPYDVFIREYGPPTLALEMVLAKPENRFIRLEGEWAELTYGGNRPGTGRPFRVVVAAVRNHEVWSLVAGRNEARERTEAAARDLLLSLAGLKNLPDAGALAAGMIADAEAARPFLRQYRFDVDGPAFKAVPLGPELRAFHVDAWGRVGESDRQDPPPANAGSPVPGRTVELRTLGPIPELGEAVIPPQPAIPIPKRPSAAIDDLPELAEPDIPAALGVGGAAPGEMPELPQPPSLFDYPDAAPVNGSPRILDPERIELPDVIGRD